MLNIYRNDKGYPVKVVDNDKELVFMAVDDELIEIICSFDDMKKQLSEGITENIRYCIDEEQVPSVDFKSVSLLYIEVRDKHISLIGSFDLMPRVRDDKWGLNDFVGGIKEQLKYYPSISINYYEFGEDAFMWLEKQIASNIDLEESINCFIKEIEEIINNTRIAMSSFLWKEEYFENERIFCEEVLTPLFRHMEFNEVIFNHGTNEFGKDYILSEISKINNLRYYGVQVKAGNIDGGVNSQIDNLIYQIRDAFEMPFNMKNGDHQCYISELIIVISGKFTSNAKEKIRYKVPKGIYGAVHFLDKEDIENLVMKYWRI